MIQTVCPLCQAGHKLPDSQLGKRMKCSECDGTFVVESDGPAKKETATATRPASRSAPPPPPPAAKRPGPPPPPPAGGTRRRPEETPRPARRTRAEDRDEDEDERPSKRKKKQKSGGGAGLIIGLLLGLLVLAGGGGAAVYFLFLKESPAATDSSQASAGPGKTQGDSGKGKSSGDSEKEKPAEPITTPVLPTIPTSAPPNIAEEGTTVAGSGTTGTDPKGTDPKGTDPKGTEPPSKGLAGAFALLADKDNDKIIQGLTALKEVPVEESQRDAVGRAINPLLNRGGVRTQALAVCARWASKENLGKLLQMLDNGFGDFDGAAETLGAYKSEEAATALAKHLPNGGRTILVSQSLKKIGKIAEKPVLAYLHHEKTEVRVVVEGLLNEYGTPPTRKRDQAISDLNRPHEGSRLAALETLAKIPPDKDSQEKGAKGLVGLLTDRNGEIRRKAMKCLEKWAVTDNVPTLIEMLDNKDKEVRKSAIAVLAKLKDERAAEPLAAHMNPKSDDLQLIVGALVAFGPKAEKAVMTQLTNTNVQIRHIAVAILAEIGTNECMPALLKLGKAGVITQRAAADARKKIVAREKAKAAMEKEQDKEKDK